MILRHWPSAWTWLATVSIDFSVAPSGAIRLKWIGMKYSAMMWRPEVGSRWWMSATRPASEFSIGIMARSAAPLSTAAKQSSNVGHGTASARG